MITYPTKSQVVPDLDVYYSFSPIIPTPARERLSIQTTLVKGILSFSFVVKAEEVEQLAEPAFLHVTAEASVNSQSRRRISRNALHFCDGFEMTMEVVESEESMIGSVGGQNLLS